MKTTTAATLPTPIPTAAPIERPDLCDVSAAAPDPEAVAAGVPSDLDSVVDVADPVLVVVSLYNRAVSAGCSS